MSRFAWAWEFSISQFLLSVLIRKKEMTTVSKQVLSLQLPPLTTGVARIISSLETPVSYTYCRQRRQRGPGPEKRPLAALGLDSGARFHPGLADGAVRTQM